MSDQEIQIANRELMQICQDPKEAYREIKSRDRRIDGLEKVVQKLAFRIDELEGRKPVNEVAA